MRPGDILGNLSDGTKHVADAGAAMVVLATLTKALPAIAALFTIIWLAIRIWESDTVRGWTKRPLTGKRDDA
jgi:hypothetical protein